MVTTNRFRWRAVLSVGAVAVLVVACKGILGIEELKVEARPGSGGASGAGGDAVGSAGSAGSSAGLGGSGGTGSNEGGRGGMSAGLGGSDGLASPDAGAPDAGGSDETVVEGRVIDFFRRPVPTVPVTIGGTTVVTDAQGRFSIPGVEGPYTVSMVLNRIVNGGTGRYGWVFEGLTRRDPTLQVYTALPTRGAGSLLTAYEGITFAPGLHYATLAWSSPDGEFAIEEATGPVTYAGVPSWTGPATTTGTVHALDAFRDQADGLPVAYEAYQSQPLTAGDNQPQVAVSFNLPSDPSIVTGSVAGTAAHGASVSSSNYVSLLFEDGTGMPLIDDSDQLSQFSYFVPALPGTSLVVAAADGVVAPYGVVHRGNIAVGQSDVALTVPRPVNLSSPQAGAPVNPSTSYSWSPIGQTAQTFLWHLEFNATYEGMYVLTSRTQIELPQFSDGFTVPPGIAVTWSVETHGDAPNVDALAGPNGYLDSFAFGTAYPVGPNRADGYFTDSERRGFTMSAGN